MPDDTMVDQEAQAAELQRIDERLSKAASRGERKRLNQIKHWLRSRNSYRETLRYAEQRLRDLGYPDKDE